VTRNVSEHEQQQIQQDPADDKELIRQLQDAQKLLESSKVQGSLHMGDDSSSTVSSSVSSPPESAGSGDSFEDPESRQKMLEKHDAAVRIQARSRGMQDRKIVAEMKETRRREPISQAPRDLDEASYDDEFEDEDEDEAALEGELAGLRAQMKADASAGAELAFDSEEDLRLAADRGEAEDSEEDAYDDEFENDDQETRTPRWVGSETVETEKEAKDSKEQGKVGGDAQVQAAVKDTGSDVLSMQIGIIQAEWAGATRHEKIRKFATERLAHSIVLDLVDAVVECQEALATKRERDRVRQELEDNRGYRKPRIVEAITEHIKRAHAEELRMKEQLFIESNRWFRERGARLRALKRAEADSDLKQKQKTAEYVQMRRAKVDQIYEAREQEKALNKMKVNDLKAQRLRESQELRLFVKRCKQQEEARAEEELKGGLVNDAKQRRQALLAQTLKDKMIAEKQMMHELGVKAARRRVLKEEKKEREFQKFAQVLGARKTKRNKQRQVKRESMMKLYESSLQAAEEMRNKKHSADLSSSKGAVMGGAKDPNEALKFAIGAYFSDPGAGFMESKTRKLMGNLMFQQAAGTEWTEKRIEGRLREIFTWIDKDATGQVEAKELHGALQRMGGKVSFAEVDVLLKGVDVDGDGQLTLDEFITFGKALFEQHTDVSGSKVLASPKRPGTSRLRTATPEMVHANKVERDERRKAARRVKQAEQEAKESRVQQNKARAAERRKFVHQAVTAYTKAMEDNLKDKDKEMEVMVNKVEIARRRKQQWFDRQWDEMLLVEEQYSRLLDLKRAESYANKESIWRQEQKRIAVAKRFRDTAEYEKAITAEFLISTVDGKRRMASPGFPVAVAPRKTATPVMREISSVYLARPRTSASSSYSRPYTSMGLMMGDGLLDEAIENTPDRQASSYGGVSSSVSSGTVPQSRFVLTENEKKAALDYFIRFGSKTSLGEKQMPYNRFFRMLVTMKFVPTQITESEAMQIYCAAIEKEGFEHAKESNLTQKQFLRAIFHVSEWTGRSFFEMALVSEKAKPSFTSRKVILETSRKHAPENCQMES
jgi:copper chaperone CopZ